jgi:carbon-monoxide dehydrogenase medium subunit
MDLFDVTIHRPHDLAGAISLLEELEDARILAGGTDLLVDIKQGSIQAKNLISIQHIQELKGIQEEKGRLRIGALVTPQEIISDRLVKLHLPALADAARTMASPQIRSAATIGGNIASAVPSADLPPSLMAADATVILDCGEARELPLFEFFLGPRKTVCGPGEVLVSVVIPIIPLHSGVAYQKIALREANALAVVGVASRLSLIGNKITKAAVVLGAVAPTPLLAAGASEFLIGQVPTEDLFKEAAARARKEGKPISDIRGSAWYREELIEVLTRRTLGRALERAQKDQRERREKEWSQSGRKN